MIRGAINKLTPAAVRYRINRLFPPAVLDDPDITVEKFVANPPILIYSMGKVASSTINMSLQAADIPHPIFHLHFLSHAGIKGSVEYQLYLNNPALASHIKLSMRIRKIMDEAGDRVQWRVISLVREPIGMTVSGLFENAARHVPEVLGRDGRVDTGRAIQHLQQVFRDFDEATNYACGWFDRDFKAALDIDVYEHPFDHAVGYGTFRNRSVSALCMRLEDLNRCFAPAVSGFLGLTQPLAMVNANMGSEKDYAAEYQYVRDHLIIPEPVAAKIYDSKFVRHFYAETERRSFMDKWCRTRPTP